MSDLFIYCNWLFNFSVSQTLLPQLILLYTLFLMIRSKNIFYALVYFFLELLFLGIFTAFYQMELYTGFLWVAEFSIVLVFLILLIYLNTDGYLKYTNFTSALRYLYLFAVSIPIIFSIRYSHIHMPYDFIFDYVTLWDDFYESLHNVATNDFNGLFISYYVINSFEFVVFALLLFFGTLLCVALYRVFFVYKLIPYSNFFSIFDFFSIKLNYNFLRHQNLHKQTSTPASNRVIKKK